ncbi:MAG TPA: glycosyltransferase family 39 protein [Bryobacteraceae bacterium]|nr:glycosyltransferase family 39 protein [Bryobacteraceae bacterium]
MKSPSTWLCILFVLLLRVPFLNQPIQGDDVYYLAGAEHAQVDPLHPHHTRYAFQGDMVDMRGHPHPPMNAWILGLLLAMFGDIREVPFHAAYVVFSLIAALSMLSLARRFVPCRVIAAFLFLATPAFVINGMSLESDLPLVALWLAATALFIKAVDSRSRTALLLSVLTLAFAAMTGYQAVVLIPILWVYLWTQKRGGAFAWLATLTPAIVIIAWQLFERVSSGALPAAVLGGYFTHYGFENVLAKVQNALALTVQTAWLVFPLLLLAVFWKLPRWFLIAAAAATAGLVFVDPNPLFWASWFTGILVIAWCGRAALRDAEPDVRFLAAWVVIFFAAALVLFFAGAARYLLPIAAPVALIVVRALQNRRLWLWSGLMIELALSLGLAVVNYQHWNAYRSFAMSLAPEIGQGHSWINADWGFRFYLEAEGALPLLRGQALQPGDLLITSDLGGFTASPPGAPVHEIASRIIQPAIPLRLIGLQSRSGYDTASRGLRPFDISRGIIDRISASIAEEHKATLSWLPMNAPEAPQQIISGIYSLESNSWRWTAGTAILLLKSPPQPLPVKASFFIPPQAIPCHVTLSLDGKLISEQTFLQSGAVTLISPPQQPAGGSVTLTLAVGKTFSVPGDNRQLGLVLKAVGFQE